MVLERSLNLFCRRWKVYWILNSYLSLGSKATVNGELIIKLEKVLPIHVRIIFHNYVGNHGVLEVFFIHLSEKEFCWLYILYTHLLDIPFYSSISPTHNICNGISSCEKGEGSRRGRCFRLKLWRFGNTRRLGFNCQCHFHNFSWNDYCECYEETYLCIDTLGLILSTNLRASYYVVRKRKNWVVAVLALLAMCVTGHWHLHSNFKSAVSSCTSISF